MESNPKPISTHLLRRYFYSGWAFFIPYLFFYLLYYWRKWPVNPWPDHTLGSGGHIPALLHVYWTLHIIHGILGIFALGAWWREQRSNPSASPSSDLSVVASAKSEALAKEDRFQFSALFPWALLALIFYIPGVYLEWPSDPWEHYARINEWSRLHTVGEHSTWLKSSYFLVYSLLSRISPPTQQLFWLDFYYTAACLLLCWQYYRLARVVGLSERTSLVFVILQAVLFGNNIFSFYRYYGISSSIYAQLGAVALTRLGIEFAQQLPARPSRWLSALGCTALLALLTAFNHVQGLGIAALGLAAVALWRLIAWKRSMLWWVLAAALAISVFAVLRFPRHPAIDQIYRPQGWFTAWYGFNIFSTRLGSFGALDRVMWILGLFGVVNLGAGLWLLRHNHIVGWLTLVPLLALCLPFITIPLADAILRHNPQEGVITFPRMLFAIPAGLAIVTAFGPGMAGIASRKEKSKFAPESSINLFAGLSRTARPSVFTIGLIALLAVPSSQPWYNHFYNAVVVPPEDLSMRHVVEAAGTLPVHKSPPALTVETINSPEFVDTNRVLATPGIGYVLQSTGRAFHVLGAEKLTQINPASTTGRLLENLHSADPQYFHAMRFTAIDSIYTAFSQCALMSGHWLSNAVALEHAGQVELFDRPAHALNEKHPPQLWLEWTTLKNGAHYFGTGTSVALLAFTENRGAMCSQGGFSAPTVGDRIVLRPVLRTIDGDGWCVSVMVTGPNSSHQYYEAKRWPSPLAGETWIFSDFEVRLDLPGTYALELCGDVAWPAREYRVRYTLTVAGNQGLK